MDGRFHVVMRALGEEVSFRCDAHAMVLSDHDGNIKIRTKHRSGRDLALLGEAMEDMDYEPQVHWPDGETGKVFVADLIDDDEEIHEAKGLAFIGLEPGEEVPIAYTYRISSRELDFANELLQKLYFDHVTSEEGKGEESGWAL